MLDWRDHITSDPEILNGQPILKGTRLSVSFVLELLAAGYTRADFEEDYPSLTEERVRAVLSYIAEGFREERLFLVRPPTAA